MWSHSLKDSQLCFEFYSETWVLVCVCIALDSYIFLWIDETMTTVDKRKPGCTSMCRHIQTCI